jgi:hypothetical protein
MSEANQRRAKRAQDLQLTLRNRCGATLASEASTSSERSEQNSKERSDAQAERSEAKINLK